MQINQLNHRNFEKNDKIHKKEFAYEWFNKSWRHYLWELGKRAIDHPWIKIFLIKGERNWKSQKGWTGILIGC